MSLLSWRRCARNFGQTTAQESKKIHFRWTWVAQKRSCLSPLVNVSNNDNLTTGTLTTRIAQDRPLFAHRRGDLCIHEALRYLRYHWPSKTHLLLFLGVGALFGSFICFSFPNITACSGCFVKPRRSLLLVCSDIRRE